MAVFDEFLQANRAYATQFNRGDLPMPPARKVAVLTCMDARLHPSPNSGHPESAEDCATGGDPGDKMPPYWNLHPRWLRPR